MSGKFVIQWTQTFVVVPVRKEPGVGPCSAHPGEGDEAGLAAPLLPVVPHAGATRRPPHPGEGDERGVLRPPPLARVDVGS